MRRITLDDYTQQTSLWFSWHPKLQHMSSRCQDREESVTKWQEVQSYTVVSNTCFFTLYSVSTRYVNSYPTKLYPSTKETYSFHSFSTPFSTKATKSSPHNVADISVRTLGLEPTEDWLTSNIESAALMSATKWLHHTMDKHSQCARPHCLVLHRKLVHGERDLLWGLELR